MQKSKSDPDKKPLIYCTLSVVYSHLTFTFHSHSIHYRMQTHLEANKSLLYILPMVSVSLLEPDVYSDFMHVYVH